MLKTTLLICLFTTIPQWQVVNRSIDQSGGVWQVDYRLKNTTGKPVKISAHNLKLTAVGDVSNSIVPGHSLPKTSRHSLVNGDLKSTSELIKFDKETCGEKLEVYFGYREVKTTDGWYGDFVLNNNDFFLLKLRFVHEHVVYENHDPLLGTKHLELSLGGLQLIDTLPLNDILHISSVPTLNLMEKIPEDRRDSTVFYSAPYSLHLEAHIAGNQYFRFPETPVKYSTKMRLKFKYLIARGTYDDFGFKISQYKDTPTSWKVLSEGSYQRNLSTTLFGMRLKNTGVWKTYDQIIQVQPDATTMAIDFRFSGDNEVGEAWVDNISLCEIGVREHPQGP